MVALPKKHSLKETGWVEISLVLGQIFSVSRSGLPAKFAIFLRIEEILPDMRLGYQAKYSCRSQRLLDIISGSKICAKDLCLKNAS